jgi:predicted dehydrogenase
MKPRIGCLGLGWIGRHRLQAIVESGLVDVTTLWDDDPVALEAAQALAPHARAAESFDALLDAPLDGLMIATPSALHATQTEMALRRDMAVFCQKPLARTREETERVVHAARQHDRLLHVDLSYRFARAFDVLTQFVHSGGVGTPFAIDLTFHNAYGPDKPWYYTRQLSGGGCAMDLGIHLVDLALRLSGPAAPTIIASNLFSNGARWEPDPDNDKVEDLAYVHLEATDGAVIRIACSWRLPAGCDAVIGATVYGPLAGVRVRNVSGSFYDFVAERLDRGGIQLLTGPPDAWGGRAAVEWAVQLAKHAGYDPACEQFITLAGVIDEIYEVSIASNASARCAEVWEHSTRARAASPLRRRA